MVLPTNSGSLSVIRAPGSACTVFWIRTVLFSPFRVMSGGWLSMNTLELFRFASVRYSMLPDFPCAVMTNVAFPASRSVMIMLADIILFSMDTFVGLPNMLATVEFDNSLSAIRFIVMTSPDFALSVRFVLLLDMVRFSWEGRVVGVPFITRSANAISVNCRNWFVVEFGVNTRRIVEFSYASKIMLSILYHELHWESGTLHTVSHVVPSFDVWIENSLVDKST